MPISCLLAGTQLHEANQELQFKNTVEDLERWLGDAEQQAASEDYGKGLADVQNLLRRHGFLESAVGAHQVGCQLSGRGRPERLRAPSSLLIRETEQETKGKHSKTVAGQLHLPKTLSGVAIVLGAVVRTPWLGAGVVVGSPTYGITLLLQKLGLRIPALHSRLM